MNAQTLMRVLRRTSAVLAIALAISSLAAPGMALVGDDPPAVNPKPRVVPALQTWSGGSGLLSLVPATRIVVADPQLAGVAAQLKADLVEVSGLKTEVVTDEPSRARDIVLDIDADAAVGPSGNAVAEREGYHLTVADRVRVTARTQTAVFWGTRTLLQMLVERFPERGVLPVGSTTDWPNVALRGYMLDVGRRWFGETYVRDMVRAMSWYKLNTFQVHLNDNAITAPGGDWSKAQSAFRLASEDPAFDGLAAADGSFTRAEWDELEDVAAAHHVTVVPEIDSPAHSRAFIAFRPEIGLDGGNSDHLDLSKPVTTAFMKDVFSEFTPWFRSPVVHIGLDEYPRDLEDQYRAYTNTLAAHVRSLGKNVRAWGSLTVMAGDATGYDKDMEMVSWNNGWYSGKRAIADGYPVINANDGLLYIVPFADYYHGKGLDGRWLYDNWEPHVFGGSNNVDKGNPLLLGAMSAVWNDLVDATYDGDDVYRLVEPTFGLLAHKMWRGPVTGLAYDRFMHDVGRLGVGPGSEALRTSLFDAGDEALPVTLSAPKVVGEGETMTVTASIRNSGASPVALRAVSLAVDGATPLDSGAEPADLAPGAEVERSWTVSATGSPTRFTVTAHGQRDRWQTRSAARGSVAVVAPAPPGTQHLSFDAVPSASSVEANLDRLAARHAVDGDLATRWASAYSDDQWLQLELERPSTVTSVRLSWEAACAKRYAVQTSTDGVTWTDAAVVDQSTCKTDTVTLTTSGPVTHVRMQGLQRATTYGYSLYEFWVFGNPA
ncbi:family 20 glycosylhydrolase [Nocardioides sp. NPDC006273]|uniref:family 20 glycosylhydrolase n=1 Tax=Nocardioides sp. NPDC006273 TaxID=3155598 RepID=UPI0033A747C4